MSKHEEKDDDTEMVKIKGFSITHKGIALSFECTSVGGLDAFWRLFVKGEATPYIEKIAATVSSEVREKTSLSTSINLEEFEDALTQLEATVNKGNEILKPKSKANQQSSGSELYIDTVETKTDKKSEEPCVRVKQEIKNLTKTTKISSSNISLVYQKEIHVLDGNNTYNEIYMLYACAILSHERLMIADNKRLSVVNIRTGMVEQKKTLETWYSDITVLPNDQAAVTLPLNDKILILSTNDMSLISSIPVANLHFGITYHQGELYVICTSSGRGLSVNILNLKGALLRKFEFDKHDTLSRYIKIAVSMDVQNLYFINETSLIMGSLHGQVIARYHFMRPSLKTLTLLDDGSLLVVSVNIHDIHTIHHISADLQKRNELKLDEENVRFISVDPVNNQIYVIYQEDEEDKLWKKQTIIKVYNMQKRSSKCRSVKKLTSMTPDEELSAFEAKKKLHSVEADEELTALKAEMKLPSLEPDEKLVSYKAGMKLPSLVTDEKLASYKARMKLPSFKTDEKLAYIKLE